MRKPTFEEYVTGNAVAAVLALLPLASRVPEDYVLAGFVLAVLWLVGFVAGSFFYGWKVAAVIPFGLAVLAIPVLWSLFFVVCTADSRACL
ncbi:MAG: hypothetical protein E6G94_08170 [Alphaproteobacteria bacterium]|nr:MAG: hypothetical protein E6G94_08170 [Alphaproteobacteria bacterium]